MSKVKLLACDCYLARLERFYSNNNLQKSSIFSVAVTKISHTKC